MKSFADTPPPTIYATAVEVHGVPIEAIQAQPAIADYYVPPSNGVHQGIPIMTQEESYQQHHGNSLPQSQGYGQPQGPEYSNLQNFHQQSQGCAHHQSMNGYQQQPGNSYQQQPGNSYQQQPGNGFQQQPGNDYQQQPGNGYHQQQPGNGYHQQPLNGFSQNDVGICRGCGLQYRRQPGVHDSSAEFYRCEKCSRLKLQDVISSCRLA